MIKDRKGWITAFIVSTIFAFSFQSAGCGGGGGSETSPPALPTNLQATVVSSSRIDLSWTDNSDDEEGFKIERMVSGGSYALVTSLTASATSFSDTGLTSATTYSYRVNAFNAAGDSDYSNEVSAITLLSDVTAPPDTTITSKPLNPSNQASMTFEFTSTEAGSTFECQLDSKGWNSCSSPQVYYPGTNYSDGGHTFEVRAMTPTRTAIDQTPASYTWTVDTIPPVPSGWSPSWGSIATKSPTIALSLNENGDCKWSLSAQSYADMAGDCTGDGTTSISCGVSGLSEGGNTVYLSCRDSLLNAATAATSIGYFYTVDTALPVQNYLSPSSGATITTKSPTVTIGLNEDGDCKWSLSDEDYASMVDDCTGDGTISILCGVSGLLEGANTVYIACRDLVLNADTAATNTHLTYTVDTTLPVQSGWSPASASTIATKSPTINFSLNEMGACQWFLSDQGYDLNAVNTCSCNQYFSCSCGVSGLSEGANTVYIACKDLPGNADTAATNKLLTYTVDTTPPIQSGWSPVIGNSTTPTIAFSLNENGGCRWSLTNQDYANMGGDCTGDTTTSISCAVTGLSASDGAKTIYIACQDSLGNEDTIASNKNLIYTLDTTPPVQSGWSPVIGTSTFPSITFNLNENGDCKWTSSDNAYSGTSNDCTGDGTTSISCAVSGLSEGANTVYIACRDSLLNADTGASNKHLPYTVDTTPPVQVGWSPASATTIATKSPTISFSLDESGDCKWSHLDDSYTLMADDCTGDGTTSILCGVSGLSEGANTVYIACQDSLANKDDAATNKDLTYTVDTTPPVQSVWSPTSGSTITTKSPTIAFSLDESGDCKWSTTDQDYASMTGDCTGDATTSISCAVTGLSEGANTVYLACRDSLLNADIVASNTHLIYTVDTTTPVQSGWSPVIGTSTSPNITFNLNESGDCKWSLSDDAYSGLGNDCAGDYSKAITCGVTGLLDGANNVYFACQDSMTPPNQDTIASNKDLTYIVDKFPPVQSGWTPVTGRFTTQAISFNLDESGDCKWSLSDDAYSGLGNDCAGDYSKAITCVVSGLSDGANNVYFACQDSMTPPNQDTIASNDVLNFTVDTNPPDTTITAQPSSPSNQASSTFEFTSEAGATFECQIDSGGYSACTSPKNYLGFGEGFYTFEVRAIDPAGNPDPTPASYTWEIVDNTPPTFSGVKHVLSLSDTEVMLFWAPATDDIMPQSDITYDICQSTTAGVCAAGFTSTYTAGPQEWNYRVTGLTAGQTYHFLIRASDNAATPHLDTNTVEKKREYFGQSVAVAQVSAGPEHTCALLTDKTIKCWGRNGSGQLGNGTGTSSYTPVYVSGITTAVEVSSGGAHTCARLEDKTVKCWGENTFGQLGNGTNSTSSTPVTVSGISTAVGVTLGQYHTCARLEDKTVKCWGRNYYGGLGDGSTNNSNIPVTVLGISAAAEINTGEYHSCARLDDFSIRCWGYNGFGQLGNGNNTSSYTPVTVSGITTADEISAGGNNTCARLGGNLKCWGRNAEGELGNGNNNSSNIPVPVTGITTAAEISTGGQGSCARLDDDTINCWGDNSYGQLGDGTNINSNIPVSVSGITTAAELTGEMNQNCARLADNTIKCWGRNDYGQLGHGLNDKSYIPVTVPGITTAAELVIGYFHTCARLSDKTISCWGDNQFGQLGNGTNTNSYTPVTVSGITTAEEISGGTYHTCARLTNQHVWCWGYNGDGRLGNGTDGNSNVPVEVSGISTAEEIDAGGYHTCARLTDKTLRCWGRNVEGQLGDETNMNSNIPVTVSGIDTAAEISGGWQYHTCARLDDGTLRCWGYNNNGQLGNGTNMNSNTPVTVTGITTAAEISAGDIHTCARLTDKTIRCWGNNGSGRLGDGTYATSYTPVTVSGVTTAAEISLGGNYTCARLADDNTLKCWGSNQEGQLGDGTTTSSNIPVSVPGITGAAEIIAGKYHTCARLADNTLRCWGSNGDGQLGGGYLGNPNTQAPVISP